MRKRSKRRKYGLSLYRAWILLAFSLFILSPVLGELKCLVGSYTIKNWIPCQQLPLALQFVTPRCSMSTLPQCLNNDPTCPDYGVMPCQYSVITTVDSQGNEITVSGSIRNGNSQCPLYEDKEICDFADTYCTKTVEAQYQDGSITQWLIIKSCGECAYSIYSTAPCDPTQCIGSAVCSGCYWESDATPTITRCYECTSDYCNSASTTRRRIAHQTAALVFGSAALALVLRKCCTPS